jgi:hypothetical protein
VLSQGQQWGKLGSEERFYAKIPFDPADPADIAQQLRSCT